MVRFFRSSILILSFEVCAFIIAQDVLGSVPDYLWPTNASKYLTSAFCEHRDRRFHTGIDIKTWGRIGYKVFAIRPGYVWRISVSPYGYGKAIYLKLDTGEIAVYAHLSKFSDKIQNVVEAEQKRLSKYRINKYFSPGALPVAQGEVIAYTGQTGIGAPHLHFEIRDAGNNPINPLSKGFQLPDKVSPIIRGVSFTPLDAHSEVNGDFKPVIATPLYVSPGQYLLDKTISFWGNVGLAISCYDKGSNSSNRFGIYSLKLYVDENLRFQYKYDKVFFQKNRMVELERDYRLARRGFGRYYKLYKDKHNTLSNYVPNKSWAGVLKSASLIANPSLQSSAKSGNVLHQRSIDNSDAFDLLYKGDFQTGAMFPGLHGFRIEVSDYFGNISTVRGKLQVGAAFDIQPVIIENDSGNLGLSDIITYDLRKIVDLDAFALESKQWKPIPVEWTQGTEESGGHRVLRGTSGFASAVSLNPPSGNPLILKFIAQDQFGANSYPFIYVKSRAFQSIDLPQVNINYDFYDDYLRLELTSNVLMQEVPRVILYPGRPDSVVLRIHPMDMDKYVGRIELAALFGDIHTLKVTLEDLNAKEFTFKEQFACKKIPPSNAGRLISEDQKCWISFSNSSLYKPFYGRVAIDTLSVARHENGIGHIYNVEPKDVPLKGGATVQLQYPPDELHPEKLGVYYKNRRGKWEFIDNKIDTTKKAISAKVFSLEEFTVIRDEQPPEI
ncbi:MAG: M23 family metallopeptidase, partial [bacterium]